MIHNLDNYIGNISVCNFCILLLTLVVLLNAKHLFSSKVSDKVGTGYVILWVVFTVYSCFFCPPGGDNYLSMKNYEAYLGGVDKENLHFEPLYFLLMDIFSFGYVSWRFAVWGLLGATSFIYLSKLLHLDKHLTTVVCFTFALPVLLYYQRAVCGYCLLYMAMAIYINNPRGYSKVNRMVLAILLSAMALLFHMSMPFYLIVLIISIFVPLNKRSIILLLIVLFIIGQSLFRFSDFFLSFMADGTQETGYRYLENAQVMNKNLAGRIFELLDKAPVYFMVLLGISQQLRGKVLLSKTEKVCLLNTFIIIIISLMFKNESVVIESKFYKASMLPFTLFLASYFPKLRGTRVATMYVWATAIIIVLITMYKVSRGVFYFTA